MSAQEDRERAHHAQAIVGSEIWKEAWAAYDERLIDIIRKAEPHQADKVMDAKRLLTAGQVAKGYLERLIVDGKVAAERIMADENESKLRRLVKRWA